MGRPCATADVIDLLLIGYGNDLRSDDGAGRVVADRIEEMGLEGVRVLSASQLMPEMALELAAARRVVFVDASVAVEVLTERVVQPGGSGSVMTHRGDPGSLLAMASEEGHVPEAVLLEIPATNFQMGFDLSPPTAAGVEKAVRRVMDLVG